MKFFNLFKAKSAPSKDPGAASAVEMRSRRHHPRYAVAPSDFFYIEDSSGGKYRVVDFSFKGSLVEPIGPERDVSLSAPSQVVLVACGQRANLLICSVQKRSVGTALVFDHTADEAVFALTRLVEPLRLGSSCNEIPQGNSKDNPDSRRKRYSGDGPLDVILDRSSYGNVQFAMITVRRGASYWSLLWEDGAVITKKSVDDTGVGARMAQTSSVDTDLVAFAVVACLAMASPDGKDLANCLGNWLSRQH